MTPDPLLDAYRAALGRHRYWTMANDPARRESARIDARDAWTRYVASQPTRSIPRVELAPIIGPTDSGPGIPGPIRRGWDGSDAVRFSPSGDMLASRLILPTVPTVARVLPTVPTVARLILPTDRPTPVRLILPTVPTDPSRRLILPTDPIPTVARVLPIPRVIRDGSRPSGYRLATDRPTLIVRFPGRAKRRPATRRRAA